jgi:uncharacterized protein with FMN-binding domain
MRRFLTLTTIALAVLIPTAIGCIDVDEMMGPLELKPIDFSSLETGRYYGEYDSIGRAKVEVAVDDAGVSEIALLEHECTFVGRRAEYIIPSIIEKQTLEVDAISGATASSRVILKAVEDALLGGAR